MAGRKKTKLLKELDTTKIIQEVSKSIEVGNDEKEQFAIETGTLSASHISAREKIKRVLDLHIMGLSPKSILREINTLAPIKGWTKYTNERSIQGVISKHYKDYQNPNEGDLDDHLEGLKQSMFAQQEHIIEKASLFVADKDKKWAPFEYISALKEVYAMRQQVIENQNFNLSKKNNSIGNTNITNQLNVFVDNSRRIAFGQVETQALTDLKSRLLDKFSKKNLDFNEE